MVGKLEEHMKKTLLILVILSLAMALNSQSPENKSWSIDYPTWNDNGTPALHINCGTDEAFDFDGDFTIELWVRAWNFVENRKLVGKCSSDGSTFEDGYIMGFTENQVYTEYFNPSSQQIPITASGTLPFDSAYVHIASVYSTSQGKLFNYVNGNLSGETDMFPNAPISAELAPLIIGSASWGDFTAFQSYGDIDEVRIWSKELTGDDLKAGMHSVLQGNEEDLVAYYNFNNASGEMVPDDGPNSLDGTLTNSDHISTAFSLSGAPVADLAMNGLQDVQAAWYRTEENFHKITSDNGLSVITDIEDKEFWRYLVMGNTETTGSTADNAPSTAPLDFNRTAREWYIKCSPNISGTFTVDLSEANAGSIQDNLPLDQYAILWRPSLDTDFLALANPTSPLTGIFQFQNFNFLDGYYAFGVSGETFELQTGVEELSISREIELFPNPTNTGSFVLSGLVKNDRISICNALGESIQSYTSNSNMDMKIELNNQPRGTYVVQIVSNNSTITKRIILQ